MNGSDGSRGVLRRAPKHTPAHRGTLLLFHPPCFAVEGSTDGTKGLSVSLSIIPSHGGPRKQKHKRLYTTLAEPKCWCKCLFYNSSAIHPPQWCLHITYLTYPREAQVLYLCRQRDLDMDSRVTPLLPIPSSPCLASKTRSYPQAYRLLPRLFASC